MYFKYFIMFHIFYILELCGIGGLNLQWLKPYMTDRVQFVWVSMASDPIDFNYGVPHGLVDLWTNIVHFIH